MAATLRRLRMLRERVYPGRAALELQLTEVKRQDVHGGIADADSGGVILEEVELVEAEWVFARAVVVAGVLVGHGMTLGGPGEHFRPAGGVSRGSFRFRGRLHGAGDEEGREVSERCSAWNGASFTYKREREMTIKFDDDNFERDK